MRTSRSFAVLVALALFPACGSSPTPDPDAFVALGIKNSFTPEGMDGVYCSGQPTEAQFAQLKDVGVARVVHLRLAEEEEGTGWEEQAAEVLGIEFVRIPVDGAAGVTVENAQAIAAQTVGADGAVLVSCGSSNRVGALFAVKARFLDGKGGDEAIAIGKACGMTRLLPMVTEMVSR